MPPYVHDRSMIDGADELIARHGAGASLTAEAEAEQSRAIGNLHRFCRWRQIARLIDAISADAAPGTLH